MLYNVGEHNSDEQAENACSDAGLRRSGIGDPLVPEPGTYYFPRKNGVLTGWPRVWALNGSGDYEWIDLNPNEYTKSDELEALPNEIMIHQPSGAGQTRIIEGILLNRVSNAPLANYSIYFIHQGLSFSNTSTYPSSIHHIKTNKQGHFQIALAVPDGISEEYLVSFGSEIYKITVFSGDGRLKFRDLLKAAIKTGSEQCSTLNMCM